jgi:hypothetical protein
MQPITCLSHYVRSVYAYSMLRKAPSDIPVVRHLHCFLYLALSLVSNFPGTKTEIIDT